MKPQHAHPPTRQHRELMKRGRGFGQPDLYFIIVDGRRLGVLKTWENRPWLERRTLGTWLCDREARTLHQAWSVNGIPRLLERPKPWGFVMSYLDAAPLAQRDGEHKIPNLYFDRLWSMIVALHRIGVNHGDLRKKNLLAMRDDSLTPVLVDFTQSFCYPHSHGFVQSVILRIAFRVDRVKFLELKGRFAEDGLTESEQEELEGRPWYMRLGRALRGRLYRPFKHRVYGRRKGEAY